MELESVHNNLDDEGWRPISLEGFSGSNEQPLARQQALLWALVLESRSVPCRLESGDIGWKLLVPETYYAAACRELRQFEKENRHWPPSAPAVRPLVENTLATLSILLLLAVFHNLIQLDLSLPGWYAPDWVDLGNAQAAKIVAGQWWRLVTALTLHADWNHLSSNLAIGGIFVIFLCRELGSGLAWSLLLGSGMLGNLVNAYVQSPSHSSVGASTAVFGAVGILAAISLVRHRQELKKRWLPPVAAALALLALLGTEGKNTDLGAHLFGFVYGACFGLVTEYLVVRYGRPGRVLNALLALASGALVMLAWWLALHNRAM